jgi:hypothetical protein
MAVASNIARNVEYPAMTCFNLLSPYFRDAALENKENAQV